MHCALILFKVNSLLNICIYTLNATFYFRISSYLVSIFNSFNTNYIECKLNSFRKNETISTRLS